MAHRRARVLGVAGQGNDDVDGAREGARAAGALADLATALAVVATHEDGHASGGQHLERRDRLEGVAGVVLGVTAQSRELGQRVDDEDPGADRVAAGGGSGYDTSPGHTCGIGPGKQHEVVAVRKPRPHEGGLQACVGLLGEHDDRPPDRRPSEEGRPVEDAPHELEDERRLAGRLGLAVELGDRPKDEVGGRELDLVRGGFRDLAGGPKAERFRFCGRDVRQERKH